VKTAAAAKYLWASLKPWIGQNQEFGDFLLAAAGARGEFNCQA